MKRPQGSLDVQQERRNAVLAAACGWVQGVWEARWDGNDRPPTVRAGWARGSDLRVDPADYDDDAQIYELLTVACARGWSVDVVVEGHGWLEVHVEREDRWQVAFGAGAIGRALSAAVAEGLELDCVTPWDDDDEDDCDG
jgi:hypothetical protein